MNPTRRNRIALLAVAAALLVAGLAGPVRRALDDRERHRAAASLAEQVARENAAIAADYATNRDKVLAEVRALIDRGEAKQAMALAGRYVPVGDAAVRELHREAANAESLRQRGEMYRALVRSDCAEAAVLGRVAKMLAASVEPGVTVGATLTATRLTGLEARETVLARLREPADPEREDTLRPRGAATPPSADAGKPAEATPQRNVPVMKGPVDWVTRMRQDNRARPLPDYLGMVYSPIAGDVMCVWRIGGRREHGSRSFAFTMDVWMAPAPDSKSLTADPVRYVERPV